MQQSKGKQQVLKEKNSKGIEVKFSIPSFSSLGRNEKIKLVGWAFAILLLAVFLITALKIAEKGPLFPGQAPSDGEVKVESKQDATKTMISAGNDIEGLIGSLRELDEKIG